MPELQDDAYLLTATDEQSAFRILYNRYWELLYTKALTRLGNSADAQDVVQEIFISLWRNKTTIQVVDSLSPYLLSALRYSVIKRVYRKAKFGSLFLLPSDELAEPGHDAADIFQLKELQKLIGKEVSNLPPRMQEVYRLSRIEQLSSGEIAERLSISEQTVKNTLTTTLKKLRSRVSPFISLFFLF